MNEQEEQWKMCYTNYFVSTRGRVRKGDTPIKSYVAGSGHLQVRLCIDNQYKFKYVHRLVAEAFLDNPENYPIIDHIDKSKVNNCIENLRWASHSMNQLNRADNREENEKVLRSRETARVWREANKDKFVQYRIAYRAKKNEIMAKTRAISKEELVKSA